MKTKLTYCDKAEIWSAKKSWKQDEKGRKLMKATSLQQLEACAAMSCRVNRLLDRY
jgi:hypothetical protein